MHYLTDACGALQVFADDQQATDWATLQQWRIGAVYRVQSAPLTVTTHSSGSIDLDVALTDNAANRRDLSHNEPVTVLRPATSLGAVGGAAEPRVLKLASLDATL